MRRRALPRLLAPLIVSLLLPLVCLAAVSSTTSYNTPYTTTTASATLVEHTSVTEAACCFDETSMQYRVDGYAQTLLGISQNFNAPKKGLTTPKKYFGGKTKPQVEKTLTDKFGPAKTGAEGGKSFYNPRTKRTFHPHQHPSHRGGKPHVDVRQRGTKGTKIYDLLEE